LGRGNFIKWTVKAPARSLGGKTTPIEFGKSSEKHRAKVTLVKGRLSVPEAEFEPRSRTPGGLLVLIVLFPPTQRDLPTHNSATGGGRRPQMG